MVGIRTGGVKSQIDAAGLEHRGGTKVMLCFLRSLMIQQGAFETAVLVSRPKRLLHCTQTVSWAKSSDLQKRKSSQSMLTLPEPIKDGKLQNSFYKSSKISTGRVLKSKDQFHL